MCLCIYISVCVFYCTPVWTACLSLSLGTDRHVMTIGGKMCCSNKPLTSDRCVVRPSTRELFRWKKRFPWDRAASWADGFLRCVGGRPPIYDTMRNGKVDFFFFVCTVKPSTFLQPLYVSKTAVVRQTINTCAPRLIKLVWNLSRVSDAAGTILFFRSFDF